MEGIEILIEDDFTNDICRPAATAQVRNQKHPIMRTTCISASRWATFLSSSLLLLANCAKAQARLFSGTESASLGINRETDNKFWLRGRQAAVSRRRPARRPDLLVRSRFGQRRAQTYRYRRQRNPGEAELQRRRAAGQGRLPGAATHLPRSRSIELADHN